MFLATIRFSTRAAIVVVKLQSPRAASVFLSPIFFIAKTQQQCFKLIKCLLLIGPDCLEDNTVAAIQIGTKHFEYAVGRRNSPRLCKS